jgi:hypothetical protein
MFLTSDDGHADCWNMLWLWGDGARYGYDDDTTGDIDDKDIWDDDARDDTDEIDGDDTASNGDPACASRLAGGDKVRLSALARGAAKDVATGATELVAMVTECGTRQMGRV